MTTPIPFSELGLDPKLLTSITELGYERPTPVQEQSLPILLQGHDLLAQAQTGTGKTAAFALPILSKIDVSINKPQALVIAPTRELAIQVSEAFQSYSRHLKGFHVLPIYGGQDYKIQLRALSRGAHVIVATPGRAMDHLRRGTLILDSLKTVVLDEADEMLKQGFLEDITWILEQIPQDHQTALFSATMPASILNISKKYLKNAKTVQIKSTASSDELIEQVYIRVEQSRKLDVLTRFLEVEDITAAIIFSRTKTWSEELAQKLQARGYAAEALNGDMNQANRQKVIDRIKNGSLDIIVATDVAARGIDVERVSHVINYDIPHDTESYVHRIGRTGRAGRKGKAILFVTPREFRLLKDIERVTRKPIKQLEPPTLKERDEKRSKVLAEKVKELIDNPGKLKHYRSMVDDVMSQLECDPTDLAAAIVCINQQVKNIPASESESSEKEFDRPRRSSTDFKGRPKEKSFDKTKRFSRDSKPSFSRDSKPAFSRDSKAKDSKGFAGKKFGGKSNGSTSSGFKKDRFPEKKMFD